MGELGSPSLGGGPKTAGPLGRWEAAALTFGKSKTTEPWEGQWEAAASRRVGWIGDDGDAGGTGDDRMITAGHGQAQEGEGERGSTQTQEGSRRRHGHRG